MTQAASLGRRFLDFFLVRLLLEGLAVAVALTLLSLLHRAYRKGLLGLPYSALAEGLVTVLLLYATIRVYALAIRWLERRNADEARPDARYAALGLLVGSALFCAVYAVFAALGIARFIGFGGGDGLRLAFLIAATSAVGEELLFRGVLFRILEDSFGTGASLIFTAMLFGVMHAGNPGASYFSTLGVALEAGVLLAVAYAWSRNLWLVIALHFAWNFTEGGVFGAAVSGTELHGLVRVPLSTTAPDLLTGGAFGPEASVVAVILCLTVAAVFAVAATRAGRWQPWRFRLVLS